MANRIIGRKARHKARSGVGPSLAIGTAGACVPAFDQSRLWPPTIAPPAELPLVIPGLAAWWDAQFSPLWQNAARTIAAVADADPVRVIDDLSGNGRHLIAASDSARATLKLNILNGKPVLRFDGVDDLYRTAGSFLAKHIFVVAKYSGATFGFYPGLVTKGEYGVSMSRRVSLWGTTERPIGIRRGSPTTARMEHHPLWVR